MDNCCICLENLKLPYRLECNHQFCYLCLKFSLLNNNLKCPLCRQNVNFDVLENATIETDPSLDTKTYIWLYSGRHNGFWKYDDISQDLIENKYRLWLAQQTEYIYNSEFDPYYGTDEELKKNGYIQIDVGGINPFYFNFKQMIQYNHRNDATRNIKRINVVELNNLNIKIKGVAGLKC